MKAKAVVIFSGGMDSTTLLYLMRAQDYGMEALSFNYGQRHLVELNSAIRITTRLGIAHHIVDVKDVGRLIAGESALVNDQVDVPHGHYADATMKQTVVPNRNMIMLSIAIGRAIATKAHVVAYGAHAGDHAIYPDCRSAFIGAMHDAAQLCDWHKVMLQTPFAMMTKAQIAELGHNLKVPWDLTWSCYEGGDKHCGECGTCVERKEAFKVAGVLDPTDYRG